MSKFINKIKAKIIAPISEEDAGFVEEYGCSICELKKYLAIHFHNFIYGLYNKCPILELLLKNLCELEMQWRILFDKDFRDYLDTSDVKHADGSPTSAQADVPKKYCSACPYYGKSVIANVIFGNQSDGYCYYLGKGDFSFIRPTELLWDMCKECGINEFSDEENG